MRIIVNTYDCPTFAFELSLSQKRRVLGIAMAAGQPRVVVAQDVDAMEETVKFFVVVNGQPIPDNARWVGSWLQDRPDMVPCFYHLFMESSGLFI